MNKSLFDDLRSWVIHGLGTQDAKSRVDALIREARHGYVHYEPGQSLRIDGTECSPGYVRSLETLVEHYARRNES